MNEHEEMVTTADGTTLYTRRYAKADARGEIVLVHGFGEHSGRYDALIQHLLDKGYAVTAYDHRGHGKSGGLYGHIERFHQYEDDLDGIVAKVRGYAAAKNLFLIGHSMGGLVTLRYLTKPRAGIRGAAISAPLVAIRAKVPAHKLLVGKVSAALLPRLRMKNEINPAVLSRDAAVGRAYAKDPLVGNMVSTRWFAEALKAMAELQRQASQITSPLLVMHGTQDKLANVEATKSLFENLASSDKSLKLYEGYYHELFNEPEKHEIYERVTDWLAPRCV
ncbi:MAG: lysophospholipase [Acidobacteria bacterium]|nr:lysophospholipase [Acidobacteriota bacterium]